MKKLFVIAVIASLAFTAKAQDFNSKLATAKTAYSAGKLEDSRFAMQQMLQELDMMSGKQLLKLFPEKLETLAADKTKDNVSGSSGFVGVVTHRQYGSGEQTAELEMISNSPLVTGLNTLLSVPFLANAGGNQKVIKIDGYKALVQKAGESDLDGYDVQVPIGSNLLTLRLPKAKEADAIKLASLIPVGEIAKAVQ